MCLEDRFLTVLYGENGMQPLGELAAAISITPNAALSIVHRIAACYPQFMIMEVDGEGNLLLQADEKQRGVVTQFLADGGFTRINEEEFIQYYKKELRREKWRSFTRKVTPKATWMRWLTGTLIIAGSGLAIGSYILLQGKSEVLRK